MKRKRCNSYHDTIWPKRRTEETANVIYASEANVWGKVERIHVGEKRFRYAESPATCDIVLCHQEFKITTGSESHTLPSVEEFSDSHYCKAKSLCNYTAYVPSLEAGKPFPKIIQRERAGKDVTGESDSGDEQVPDHPCVPPFSAEELPVVQEKYHAFCDSYLQAVAVGFSNAVGKRFMEKLFSYALMCTEEQDTRFLPIQSTSTGPAQPGASVVKWSLPRKTLKTTSATSTVCETREPYADVVVYDRKTCLNVIVVEVKGSDEPCEAQNNEQMVGLWGKEQLCMLGLEVKDGKVLPKVLALEGKTMKMYFLEELDLETATGICSLMEIIVSFITYVVYC